jgi:hypothetical protein
MERRNAEQIAFAQQSISDIDEGQNPLMNAQPMQPQQQMPVEPMQPQQMQQPMQ